MYHYFTTTPYWNFKSYISKILVIALFMVTSTSFAASGQPLPEKNWHPPAIGFNVTLYYLKDPTQNPSKFAAKLATEKYGFQLVEKLDKVAKSKPLVRFISSKNVTKDFPPPSIELLHYFGRGLNTNQAQSLQAARQVLAIGFAYPSAQKLTELKKAEELIMTLAKQGDVIIWDEESREAFTPDSWNTYRLNSWQGQLPDVTKHTVIHAYNDNGTTRAITLGMGRFGLPDLVIENTVWSLNNALGLTMNAVSQQLIEGIEPDKNGLFLLNIPNIRHEVLRKKLLTSVIKEGTAKGKVKLFQTNPEEGDPENFLVSLNFEQSLNQEITESQVNFVADVFGSVPDELVYTKHDEKLLATSARARAQLPNLRKIFNKGLAPGEQIIVKAPFVTSDGGTEWMWVEIISWKLDQIKGMLRSDPRFIPNLKVGQMVEVKESELFDYIHRYPDGSEDGNETSKLLLDRQKN